MNKKINGKDYICGETCFKIGNKWRSIDDDEIAFDHYLQVWALKKNLEYGIVDSLGTEGYFTPNYRTVFTPIGKFMDCRDCNFAPKWADHFSYDFEYREKEIRHPYNLAYSFSENKGYMQAIQKSYAEKKLDVKFEAKQLSSLVKGYTFGIEYETCTGTIPDLMLGILGLVPLKDGSLRHKNGAEPYEYATVPMSGAYGIQSIADQCNFLRAYCEYDSDTSLHLHIGNLRKDKVYITALYELCFILQAELFSLVPVYKRDPQFYLGACLKNGDSRKNYARLLPAIKGSVADRIKQMFLIFSDGLTLDDSHQRGCNHPQDKKWNHHNRYFCVNFEHLLLGDNSTVEFRLKDTSFEKNDVLSWLLICIAIIRYAENYATQILNETVKPSLVDVVRGLITDFGTTSGNEYKRIIVEGLLQDIFNSNERCVIALANNSYFSKVFYGSVVVPSNFDKHSNAMSNVVGKGIYRIKLQEQQLKSTNKNPFSTWDLEAVQIKLKDKLLQEQVNQLAVPAPEELNDKIDAFFDEDEEENYENLNEEVLEVKQVQKFPVHV